MYVDQHIHAQMYIHTYMCPSVQIHRRTLIEHTSVGLAHTLPIILGLYVGRDRDRVRFRLWFRIRSFG